MRGAQLCSPGMARTAAPALLVALLLAPPSLAGEPSPAPAAAPGVWIANARLADGSLQSLWIRDGRIAGLGAEAERAARAAGAATLDAAGGLALPGFHDAHAHVRSGGESLAQLALADAASVDDVATALRRFAALHPGSGWILGRGWSYDIVPRGELPDRHVLDAALADRPVALESYDGHALWANSRALERAGVGPDTPDPPDGSIVREPGGGQPSGVLLDGAGALVERAVPAPTRDERLQTLERALRHCLRLGITEIDDFERDPAIFDLYAELAAHARLPLRVRVSLPLEGDLDAYEVLRQRHATPQLAFGYLKAFVDGVVESKTAFLLSPYAGSEEQRGRPLVDAGRLRALVAEAQRRGFPVALHAIGDAAVRLALDTFEAAAQDAPRPGLHHRIEHIEVIDDADLPRFARLGVLASMQPFHANPFGDTPDTGVWSQNLGRERLRRSFAWRSLRRAGAPLVFGSDWPVMSADPLQGLAVALTRRDARGRPAGGWNAHQALDAGEALSAYAGAPVGGLPTGGGGRIRVGGAADLVILAPGVELDRPATLWGGARVRAVLVGGELRFDASAEQGS